MWKLLEANIDNCLMRLLLLDSAGLLYIGQMPIKSPVGGFQDFLLFRKRSKIAEMFCLQLVILILKGLILLLGVN